MAIKNADLPAMPYAEQLLKDSSGLYTIHQTGLTKREMFAMAAMQGLLSSGATYKGVTTERGLLAADAVAHADALLAELERNQ